MRLTRFVVAGNLMAAGEGLKMERGALFVALSGQRMKLMVLLLMYLWG